MNEEFSDGEIELMQNSEEESYLLQAARIGADVEVLKRTPGGKYLCAMALSDLRDGVQALLDESSLTTTAAQEAHEKAKRASSVIYYMSQAIQAGETAADELRRMDNEG